MTNSQTIHKLIYNIRLALVPGIYSGVLVVILSVSFAALIFSGRLSSHISEGIALIVNASIIVGLGMTIFSRCKPIISMADEDTIPIFALLGTFIMAGMPLSASPDEVFATTVAALLVSTIIAGIGLTLLGIFRVGAFVQFLPQSVMGGYFSAVGWLLVLGGVRVASDNSLNDVDDVARLFDASQLLLWIPAFSVAIWLLSMQRLVPRNRLLAGTCVVAIALWYTVLAFNDVSPSAAMDNGFLIGPLGSGQPGLFEPLAGIDYQLIDWNRIFANSGSIGSILLISILSITLCVSGLGYLTRTELDMNHELKAAGASNIISGLAGGVIGLPSYSLTSLAIDSSAPPNRITGLITLIVCLLLINFGLNLVAYTPRFILGGILIYLGISLVRDWLYEGWYKFPLLEYLVIPIILIVSAITGFLQGIVIGLLASTILFVVKYSGTKVIRYQANGLQLMSNVDRDPKSQSFINQFGEQLHVISLQGYLFFGTAGKVFQCVKDRIESAELQALNYLVLEFSQVTGLDASAALNFQKIERVAKKAEFTLLVSGLGPDLLERLRLVGFGDELGDSLIILPDLDRSMEWCEEDLLDKLFDARKPASCFEQLLQYLSEAEIETLKSMMEKHEVTADHVLAEQGDESQELFFLESCAASAYICGVDGVSHRVRRSAQGTVFGELGFYLQVARTATVITEDAGLVYILKREVLDKIEDEYPEVAAGFHRYMAMLISERLLFTTQTLSTVLR